jgi:pimeloyl-ACP methyl ester carboxylesterase
MTTIQNLVVCGVNVRAQINPSKPLLMLVRAAPVGMNLWEGVWAGLAEQFTIIAPNLPTAWIDDEESARHLFSRYSELLVNIANEMGYPKFHFLGWTGGACIGLTMLIEHPSRLQSATLIAPPVRIEDTPLMTHWMKRFLKAITDYGDLELYTWFWLLSGLSPEYAERNIEKLKTTVQRRIAADEGRFHPQKIQKWIEFQIQKFFSLNELSDNLVPTQIVAPAFDGWAPLHVMRQLCARLPQSHLAVVPRGGGMFLWEEPESFFAAAGKFLQSASRDSLITKQIKDKDNDNDNLNTAIGYAVDEVTVVFLHGWLMSPEIWKTSIRQLRAAGIPSIAFWQSSHGPRSGPLLGYQLQSESEYLVSKLNALGVKKCILIGHSMGGMVAIELAKLMKDQVIGLGLIGSTDEKFSVESNYELQQSVDAMPLIWSPEIAEIYASKLLGKKFLADQPSWVSSWYREIARYDIPGMSHVIKAVVQRDEHVSFTKSLGLPIWVAHGNEDTMLPVDRARAMALRMHGQLTIYQGVGHCPPLEVEDEFAQDCKDFVFKVCQKYSGDH